MQVETDLVGRVVWPPDRTDQGTRPPGMFIRVCLDLQLDALRLRKPTIANW
jgi:hypothetical protein